MSERKNVPHCDTVTRPPEDDLVDAALAANEEYQNLVRDEKATQARLEDCYRSLGYVVFKNFGNLLIVVKQNRKFEEAKKKRWELWNKIRSQTLQGSAKIE